MRKPSRFTDILRRGKRRRAPRSAPAPGESGATIGTLLAGKNVLVTAAGANIGRAIALEMAAEGANVYHTEIDQQGSDSLASALAAYPVHSQGYICDGASTEAIDRLCLALAEDNVGIDIVVNNLGIQFETRGLDQQQQEEWRQTFDANLFGPLHLTRKLVGAMRAGSRPGSIIFIGSTHQWQCVGWPSYSASKAALGMLARELAVELAPAGIRVNTIAPGWVAPETEEGPQYSGHTPLHRTTISPVYIGRAAVFLASDYFSACTTGALLTVDGGMSLLTPRLVAE